jgi:transcriptional regulator with XRE-family HTH domain
MAPKRETAQEIWGNELRAAMEAAGKTGREVAEALNVEPSTVSNWVNGRRVPHKKDVEKMEEILGTNGYLKRNLKWVDREVSPEWSLWRDAEDEATELLTVRIDVVPGLLQTGDYARAVLPSEDDVQQRIERQEILTKDDAPFFEALLDESLLYRKVGNETIMADQLRHLVEMAQRDNISIRAVSLDSGGLARFAGPFVLANLDSGKQVAFIDAEIRGRIEERPDRLSKLRRQWTRFSRNALSQQNTINLMLKIAEEKWSDIS